MFNLISDVKTSSNRNKRETEVQMHADANTRPLKLTSRIFKTVKHVVKILFTVINFLQENSALFFPPIFQNYEIEDKTPTTQLWKSKIEKNVNNAFAFFSLPRRD